MPLGRWIISAAIVCHIVALTVDAIPSPAAVRALASVASESDVAEHARNRSHVYSVLTVAAEWLEGAVPGLFNATRVLRPATQFYTRAGLRQQWDMFSNPVLGDEYLRIDYWVVTTDSPGHLRVYREIVFPADSEDRLRVVHDYRNKTLSNVLALLLAEPINGRDEDRLAPITGALLRYYTSRFSRSFLSSGDRIARVTAWYGLGPIIPPRRDSLSYLRLRSAELVQYDAGPIEIPAPRSRPRVGSRSSESDIVWSVVLDEER